MDLTSDIKYYLTDSYIFDTSTPTPQQDANGEQGWSYNNNNLGEKLKLNIFDGTNYNLKLSDFNSISIQFRTYNEDKTKNPFILIESKPTGTNDADPTYHSAWVYKLNQVLSKGDLITAYIFRPPFQHKNEKFYLFEKSEDSEGDQNVNDEEIKNIYILTDDTVVNIDLLIKNAVLNSFEFSKNIHFLGYQDNLNLDNINSSLIQIKNVENINEGKSQVHINNGSAVWADTVPDLVIDSNKREGWYYTNPVAGNKMNLYFFNGSSEIFTLGELDYLYGKMTVDSWANNYQNLPFLTIYTKPTGVNDAGAFYHSKINYTMTVTHPKIGLGEECYFFGKSTPSIKDRWFQNRVIQMVDEDKQGECLDSEEILYLVVSSDSGATVSGVNLLIGELGFSFNSGENMRKMILKSNPQHSAVITSDGTTTEKRVMICGSNDGSNLRTVKCDGNGSLIVDVSADAVISSDGVTEEQRVMICGSNDGTNLRTVSTYDTGELRTVMHGEDHSNNILPLVVSNTGTLITEIEHSWDTETLENATPLAGGGTALTTGALDLGQGISHEYNDIVFFVTNSANMSIDLQPQSSPDGINWFVSAAGVSVTTTQNKSYMCSKECFNFGDSRFMRLRVVNNGVSSTNITVETGRYR